MSDERKLTEMVPMGIRLDCTKVAGAEWEHPVGLRTTSMGWPLPGPEEEPLGRWHIDGARLGLHLNANPGSLFVQDGALGLLVTTESLRGSFYEGNGPVGKLRLGRHVYTFLWPYSMMAPPLLTHFQDDRRQHVVIADPSDDGVLGLQGVTKPKSSKQDDFLSPIFSVKNRQEELLGQISEAHRSFDGSQRHAHR